MMVQNSLSGYSYNLQSGNTTSRSAETKTQSADMPPPPPPPGGGGAMGPMGAMMGAMSEEDQETVSSALDALSEEELAELESQLETYNTESESTDGPERLQGYAQVVSDFLGIDTPELDTSNMPEPPSGGGPGGPGMGGGPGGPGGPGGMLAETLATMDSDSMSQLSDLLEEFSSLSEEEQTEEKVSAFSSALSSLLGSEMPGFLNVAG